jgi:hypothetical protein
VHGNSLVYADASAFRNRQVPLQRARGLDHEVVFITAQTTITTRKDDVRLSRRRKFNCVVKADGLEYGVEIVITVLAFRENTETQVDLSKGRQD